MQSVPPHFFLLCIEWLLCTRVVFVCILHFWMTCCRQYIYIPLEIPTSQSLFLTFILLDLHKRIGHSQHKKNHSWTLWFVRSFSPFTYYSHWTVLSLVGFNLSEWNLKWKWNNTTMNSWTAIKRKCLLVQLNNKQWATCFQTVTLDFWTLTQ